MREWSERASGCVSEWPSGVSGQARGVSSFSELPSEAKSELLSR
jgi:hypothetical protein